MALSEDLLQQAHHLANLGATRPKQADLRRSISTAYYALFHLLVQDSAKRLSPAGPPALSLQIARAFNHGEMKQACNSVAGGLTPVLQELQPQGFSPGIRTVAKAFVNLQSERHGADYDLSKTYAKVDVLSLLNQVDVAFSTWGRIRLSEEANIFCAPLLSHRAWGR